MTPSNGQEQGDVVEVRSKRIKKDKSFRSDFFAYLVKRTRDSIKNEMPYVYSIDADPKYFKEVMESQDAPF